MAICVGCGLDVNGITGLLEVQLAGGDPGSGLHCDNTTGLSAAIQHTNGNGVALSGLGTTGTPLHAEVIKSPDDCNALEVRGNGLYVACQDGVAGTSAVQLSPQGSGLPQLVGDGGTFDYLNDNAFNSIHICNPTCCGVDGVVFVAVGDVYLNGHPGFIGGAHLEVNINNGGFGVVEPSTRQTLAVDSGNVQDGFLDINQNASFFLHLDPNSCADFQFRLRFNINTAVGSHIRTDTAGPQFVTRWVLTHTNCCDHVG